MNEKNKTPTYALRLIAIFIFGGITFFVGLSFFVPEGSKLTGSYDAESLLYIASAPVAYGGSESCGTTDCHAVLFKKWSEGAHGAREEQSKCEACHGALGKHPTAGNKLPNVRGDGDIMQLCLVCHRKMKARSTTGQPQISPQEHPYPHEGVLSCTKCHDPHSPAIAAAKTSAKDAAGATKDTAKAATVAPTIASSCSSCHGPSGRGGFAPQLAAVPYEVIKDKLVKYKTGELKGTMMNGIAAPMKDEDIETVAHYFAELK